MAENMPFTSSFQLQRITRNFMNIDITIFLSDSATYEPKDGTAKPTQARGNNFITGRNVMIFTGSFISVLLMIAILREMYIHHRFISLTPVNSSPEDCIYEEVAV